MSERKKKATEATAAAKKVAHAVVSAKQKLDVSLAAAKKMGLSSDAALHAAKAHVVRSKERDARTGVAAISTHPNDLRALQSELI